MGGSNKKGNRPNAPDFNKSAMTGQTNPFGNVSWSQGKDGTWNMNTSASPEMQGTMNNLYSGMEKGSGFDPSQAGQDAFNKVYGSYQSRLDPMWSQREKGFNAQMANSGIDVGSQAYGDASRTFNQGRNDAYNQAIGQSVGLGQAEQGQARQNAMLPFMQAGAMNAMMPHGNPNAPLEAAMAQYNGDLNTYSADQAKKGSAMNGLGSLGGLALGGLLSPGVKPPGTLV